MCSENDPDGNSHAAPGCSRGLVADRGSGYRGYDWSIWLNRGRPDGPVLGAVGRTGSFERARACAEEGLAAVTTPAKAIITLVDLFDWTPPRLIVEGDRDARGVIHWRHHRTPAWWRGRQLESRTPRVDGSAS